MNLNEIINRLADSKKFTASVEAKEYLREVKDKPFYLTPEIRHISGEDINAKFILFSAPGATGKTALAEYLAYTKKAFLWNTAGIQIGTGSFIGSLTKALGKDKVFDYTDALKNGESLLILDAFDEAEVRSGRENVETFLSEIYEYVENQIYSDKVSVIFLSRTDTANNIKSFCTKNKLSLNHYEIGFFTESIAKDFVKKKIINDDSEIANKEKIIEECRNVYFFKIKEIVPDEDENNFLGYAPVLEAIAKHIEEEVKDGNTMKFLENLKMADDGTGIIINIMDNLLDREQKKLTKSLREAVKNKNISFDEWDNIYTAEEQLSLILNFILFEDYEIVYSKIPNEIFDEYKNAVDSFLPQHPFLHNKFSNKDSSSKIIFTGPAFRDYTLAKLLNSGRSKSDEDKMLACCYFDERGGKTSFPSQIFFDCCMKFSGSSTVTDYITYLYEAFLAKSSSEQSSFINISSNEEEDILEFIIVKKEEEKPKTISLKISGDKKLTFWKLQNADIDTPEYKILIGRKGYETIVSNSSVIADKIKWVEPENKIIFRADENHECSITAFGGFDGNLESIQVIPEDGDIHFIGDGISGYAYNKLKDYFTERQVENDSPEYYRFVHALSSIIREFKVDRKDTLGKSKDRIDFVNVGKSVYKGSIRDFLLDKKILYIDPAESHLYKIKLNIAKEYGINFNSINNNNNFNAYEKNEKLGSLFREYEHWLDN